MIKPEILRAAEAHLRRRDKKIGKLIDAHGPCTMGAKRRDPFHVLCSSIISQQLSTKAADTIQARVAAAVLASARFMPTHFINAEHELLRAAGLSNAKAKWLIAIAQAVHSGEFSFAKLRKLDDESAIEALDALPGIGRWTAEMYLMFAMDRLDIFSMGDIGLRNALNRIHGNFSGRGDAATGEKLDDDATLAITARWAPYRSIASWYLWRLTDGDVGTWT